MINPMQCQPGKHRWSDVVGEILGRPDFPVKTCKKYGYVTIIRNEENEKSVDKYLNKVASDQVNLESFRYST